MVAHSVKLMVLATPAKGRIKMIRAHNFPKWNCIELSLGFESIAHPNLDSIYGMISFKQ